MQVQMQVIGLSAPLILLQPPTKLGKKWGFYVSDKKVTENDMFKYRGISTEEIRLFQIFCPAFVLGGPPVQPQRNKTESMP